MVCGCLFFAKGADAEELKTRTKEITDRLQSLAQSIKNAEKQLTEIKALKTHISNYSKTKSVYDAKSLQKNIQKYWNRKKNGIANIGK